MRILSAALAAALIASALTTIVRASGRRVAVVGVVLAVPPMAFYLFGTVNPSGLEIAAAVATWCTLPALLLGSGSPTAREVTRTVVAITLLAAARPLGPAFAVAIAGACAVAFASRSRLVELGRARTAQVGAAALALVVLATGAWLLFVEMPLAGEPVEGTTFTTRLGTSWGRLPTLTGQMIGRFGWLDTPLPAVLVWAWLLTTVALVGLALARGSTRERLTLVAVTLGVPALAVATEVLRAPAVGYLWQGRYSLPVFAGVPVLAALVAWRRATPRLTGRVVTIVIVLGAGCIQVIGFGVAMSRYTVGRLDWLGWLGTRVWEPRGGAVALSAVFAATALGGAGALAWWSQSPPEADVQRATAGVDGAPTRQRPTSGVSPGPP